MRSVAAYINPSGTHAWHAWTAPVMMWGLVLALGLGLIATTNDVNPQTIHTIVDAYEQAYPNLIRHASGYPTPD
jgi:hypothetical protein